MYLVIKIHRHVICSFFFNVVNRFTESCQFPCINFVQLSPKLCHPNLFVVVVEDNTLKRLLIFPKRENIKATGSLDALHSQYYDYLF